MHMKSNCYIKWVDTFDTYLDISLQHLQVNADGSSTKNDMFGNN